MDEFDLIARFFAPLASDPGAFGLMDDAAQLPGGTWVTTTDTLVESVHFIGDEPPELLAKKLLRVNLSDLVAMGAVPRHYLLTLSLPARCGAAWVEAFARGLAEDQKVYGVSLLGGDTTASPGLLVLGLTGFGEAVGPLWRANAAKPGDVLAVTGVIGDAWLGLEVAQGKRPPAPGLLEAYRCPSPPVGMVRVLQGRVRAATDLSDGLVIDLLHLCEASGVGARVEGGLVPLSAAARASGASLEDLLTGGDDYQLLLAIAPEHWDEAQNVAPLTRIGEVTAAQGLVILGVNGKPLALDRAGYQHFAHH